MIETYKLLSGKYDSQVALKLPLYLSDDHYTRGNSRKRLVNRCHYDLRKYFFSNRIIMRPSSLGGGRILRRTLSVCPSVRLSVCLSVRLTVRPVIITERHVAPPSELQ